MFMNVLAVVHGAACLSHAPPALPCLLTTLHVGLFVSSFSHYPLLPVASSSSLVASTWR